MKRYFSSVVHHAEGKSFLSGALRVLLLSALFSMFVGGKAQAIPAFAKKYNAPCTLCHSVWPKLNAVGWKYKRNAYQMEDSRDGALAGKTSPAFDLHLDSGKANPPVSLRLNGGFSVFQPDSGPKSGANPSGVRANNFLCCMDGNTLGLYAGGTVNVDTAFWASYQMGRTGLDQGFIRFANMYGPGYMGLDLGGIVTADSDAVTPNREWFSSPNPAFYGGANPHSANQGLGAGYGDIGMRIFGNPDYGPFSYDVVVVNGSRSTGQPVNTRGTAYGFMGRIDTERFSGSFRYWNNKSAELTFVRGAADAYAAHELAQTAAASAGQTVFAPNRQGPDEKTQDYVFAVNYRADRWEVDAVADFNNFTLGTRQNGANTYARDTVGRTGMSLAYIYRLNPSMNFGARYGSSTTSDYKEYFNGTATTVASARVTTIDLKWEVMPAQNARISAQWTLDMSDPQARLNPDGSTFNVQNRLFLTWDWAF